MIKKSQIAEFKKLIDAAEHITVVQAENPDGDSLGSAIALEHILARQGKKVNLFCAVEVPRYMRYIRGWDRVSSEPPRKTDLFIVVDTLTESLLQKANKLLDMDSAPTVAIDHHPVTKKLEAELIFTDPNAVATAQIIYHLAQQLEMKVDFDAAEAILTSILADTLGLSLPSVNHEVFEALADLHKQHPKLRISDIETRRREQSRKDLEIIKYKGQLLQRIEYFFDNQLASIVIPLEEIKEYSDKYNPSVLMLEEMRMAKHVKLAVSFKVYDNRITGKLREVNEGGSICDKIAIQFGGGGHPGSAGFKVETTDIAAVKKKFVTATGKLLREAP